MKKLLVQENGLVGVLCYPDSTQLLPGIILLPGSDGGIPEMFAEQLANQGYAVLALGYFGLPGLPGYLEHIHLEYFERAFHWLKQQHNVLPNKITLMGYSRGGELALLLGCYYPYLMNAIIAYVPSSVVCGGFPHPNKPAWIYQNKPIEPFLNALMCDEPDFTEAHDLKLACQEGKIPFHANTESDPYVIRDLFLARNEKNDLIHKATIFVENIRCPLLILSAEDDCIWPSALYGRKIMDRLDQNGSSIKREHINYPNVGHGIAAPYDGSIYHPVGGFWCRLGGDPDANAAARDQSWQAVLGFLDGLFNI